MWAMLQAAGAVLSRFGTRYPAVKWAVIALVGLFAVELVAREGLALMTDFQKYKQQEATTQQAISQTTDITNRPTTAPAHQQPEADVQEEIRKAKIKYFGTEHGK